MLRADIRRLLGKEEKRTWRAKLMTCLREWHKHPGFGAVLVYRYGQWADYECPRVFRWFLLPLYYLLYNAVRFTLHIELPHRARIEGGLRIYHYGGIIIHQKFVAGRGLTLNQGVIVGENEGVPAFGDNVVVNPRAVIFGKVTIGDNTVIGAGAVVTKSFGGDCIVAGIPAKIIAQKTPV